MLDASELELLRDTVRLAGRLPRADFPDAEEIIAALAGDKKKEGGRIQWVLLESLGQARIVDGRHVAPNLVRASLRAALKD